MRKNEAVITAIPKSGVASETRIIRKKIGNTVYMVSVRFSETSMENMEDKIMRLVKNESEAMKEAVRL